MSFIPVGIHNQIASRAVRRWIFGFAIFTFTAMTFLFTPGQVRAEEDNTGQTATERVPRGVVIAVSELLEREIARDTKWVNDVSNSIFVRQVQEQLKTDLPEKTGLLESLGGPYGGKLGQALDMVYETVDIETSITGEYTTSERVERTVKNRVTQSLAIKQKSLAILQSLLDSKTNS